MEPVMHNCSRLTGEPIMRILCKKTDTLVGYLYQWNNGELQPAWLQDAWLDVRYEPMFEARFRARDSEMAARSLHAARRGTPSADPNPRPAQRTLARFAPFPCLA